jgi:hypothetical protein
VRPVGRSCGRSHLFFFALSGAEHSLLYYVLRLTVSHRDLLVLHCVSLRWRLTCSFVPYSHRGV